MIRMIVAFAILGYVSFGIGATFGIGEQELHDINFRRAHMLFLWPIALYRRFFG